MYYDNRPFLAQLSGNTAELQQALKMKKVYLSVMLLAGAAFLYTVVLYQRQRVIVLQLQNKEEPQR